MMPLVGHWIGIKPPRECLSSLLSFCSTGKWKLYLPDIPAIRVPAWQRLCHQKHGAICGGRTWARQRLSAGPSVISTVTGGASFFWALFIEVTVTIASWAPRGKVQSNVLLVNVSKCDGFWSGNFLDVVVSSPQQLPDAGRGGTVLKPAASPFSTFPDCRRIRSFLGGPRKWESVLKY